MRKIIKKVVNNLLSSLGLSLEPINQRGWSPKYLRGYGKNVNSVIDVGAAYGTPSLYKAFNDKRLILIEPLKEYELQLRALGLEDYYFFLTALGANDGSSKIHVNGKSLTKSSIVERSKNTPGFQEEQESRIICIHKLDTLYQNEPQIFKPPFLIKIDTEGYELEALKGSTEILKITKFVIAEVSVQKRFEHSYRFSELIEFMKKNGFEVFDVLQVNNNPSKKGVLYMDLIFKNIN